MNVQRFVGKNAREAIAQARAACGEDAVILANRPVNGGVEILAMAGEEVAAAPVRTAIALARREKAEPPPPMSTLSFQDYVRDRQRQDAMDAQPAPQRPAPAVRRAPPTEPGRFARQQLEEAARLEDAGARALAEAADAMRPRTTLNARAPAAPGAGAPAQPPAQPPSPSLPAPTALGAANAPDLLAEVRTMHQHLSRQLSGLAWFDNVRRSPAQARLLRLLVGNGFSPSLARELVARLPDDVADAQAEQWLLSMVTHNLRCSGDNALQKTGGVFALVGPTGVGKTTTTAKIAAQFAQQHGPASVGLITVDTYRMAGSDQLRAFGSLLQIPVHTARDAASLGELLDLFKGRKLVLIDTVGLAQRDRRVAELLAGLPTSRIQRLVVLNAATQGDTLDQVAQAYSAGAGTRCVITKLDEATRCGGAIDVAIRHRLVVEGIANGQRVPEDWHRPHAQLLAQKSLMRTHGRFAPEEQDLGLLLTTPGTPAAQEPVHG